ncbi:MAG: membrane protein insertion efficiency factor YidD [bacterium]|nr:membrane protein insertion efficiency factor YidD [bacterium]
MQSASYIATKLITIYQKTISPDHGGVVLPFYSGACKFYPSCSEYTKHAINKKGFLNGMLRGAWRILRCNPFSQGGYDPA